MRDYKFIFGPIPSRRLGMSLGVSPIPKKYCSYSCVYCQVGRTDHLTDKREDFFLLDDIIEEFKDYVEHNEDFNVVTVVGEGEPTLYKSLGRLIHELKKLTSKPVVVITNGATLGEAEVREDLMECDILLPSIDAFDEESFKKIHRPHGRIKFQDSYEGLVEFSKEFKGELWLEVMLIEGINTSEEDLIKLKALIDKINYSRIFINAPVRPPAEENISIPPKESVERAAKILGGFSIDSLTTGSFSSGIADNYHAILSIIKRHPMNQFEINSFFKDRNCNQEEIDFYFNKLNNDPSVQVVEYRGYFTYRVTN
ncbi:radical SAM protein [Clostridium sp. MSJ-11]|uniref:Radical SAM protein n=1 Tax=Clostridium mobile TaxID=2841512 RepID=A0ABS6EKP7_9CLOT|nr:radical SAM protein [Clostridium mobile]MBU5485781.1 radical SAM protein [Clostridium mobile]